MRGAVLANLIDALPERFWWRTNLYFVFGVEIHLCHEGHRTIEVNGHQMASGRRPFYGLDWAPKPRVRDAIYSVDLGWLAARIAAGSLVVVLAVRHLSRS
jgi:hypothetical protein